MQNTTNRRLLILEYISDRRFVKMPDIAREFGISLRTAIADVQLLSCSHPIITENWRGGGVRAMEGWYLYQKYLRDDQEALLLSILPELQPEQQITMQSILSSFAKPKRKGMNY